MNVFKIQNGSPTGTATLESRGGVVRDLWKLGDLDLKVSFYNPILTSFQSSIIEDNRYHSCNTQTLRHSTEVYEEVSFWVYLHPADRQPSEYTRAHSID